MTRRFNRWLLPILATVILTLSTSIGASAHTGGLPGFGVGGNNGPKAGPLGLNASPQVGELPVAMQIVDADVDAEVETRTVVDGVMQDPTGPWVISWYDTTSMVGGLGNSVYSGHVDYWGVGPSVLRNVANLTEGSEIVVIGESGVQYTYALEYVERVTVAELTAEKIVEIVGPTDYAALTIITCGGEFDYDRGEYKQRDVLRARLVSVSGEGTPAGDSGEGDSGSTGELVNGGTATVTEDGVNIRSGAGTGNDVVTQANTGQVLTLIGEPQEADGYIWWPVRLEDGTEGWIVEDFLQP